MPLSNHHLRSHEADAGHPTTEQCGLNKQEAEKVPSMITKATSVTQILTPVISTSYQAKRNRRTVESSQHLNLPAHQRS